MRRSALTATHQEAVKSLERSCVDHFVETGCRCLNTSNVVSNGGRSVSGGSKVVKLAVWRAIRIE